MKMGDKAVEEVETISSGSLGLDLALGVNGYPRGRVIEIYGPESSGKTTLSLHIIAEAQKLNGICAFIHPRTHFLHRATRDDIFNRKGRPTARGAG